MTAQLACTYAALILADGQKDAATLLAVTKAAGVPVSEGMASAYASVLAGADFAKILSSISFSGAAAAPAAAAAAPAAGKKEEAKKVVEEEEDDFGMGGLF